MIFLSLSEWGKTGPKATNVVAKSYSTVSTDYTRT